MKRKMLYALVLLISFFSLTAFANAFFPLKTNLVSTNSCPAAVLHSASKAAFCSTTIPTGFPAVVTCNCDADGELSPVACEDVKNIYSLMEIRFARWGSQWLAHACAGHGTSVQECEDQWNCFMFGTNGDANQKISDAECFGLIKTSGC